MGHNTPESDPFKDAVPYDKAPKNKTERKTSSVRKGRRSASKKDSFAKKRARNKILIQWRGGIDPPNSARNIHQPTEYLDELLKVVGLSDGVDEQRLKESWSRVAGDFVAQHSEPDSIKNGVLVLKVVQPMMKFHLQQMTGKLLENLRGELGRDTVKQIVFKIG